MIDNKLIADKPLIAEQEVPRCFLCGNDQFDNIASGYDYEYETCSNPWNVVRCNQCGFCWLNPRPCTDQLATIYPPDYYSYDLNSSINPIALKAKKFIDRRKLESILKLVSGRAGRYMDIGCGDGRFLYSAEDLGFARSDIYGLELDSHCVERLRREGFNVSAERIEDVVSVKDGSLDLVSMFHVIEHVDNPVEVVQKVAELLSDGGVFAVETPNMQSLDAKLFSTSFWGGYHFPRHWTFFDESSLTRLFNSCGLEVIAIKYMTGHSFWSYSFHHMFKYKYNMNGLARFFNPLRSFIAVAGFTGWDMLRALLGFKTSSILILGKKLADSTHSD